MIKIPAGAPKFLFRAAAGLLAAGCVLVLIALLTEGIFRGILFLRAGGAEEFQLYAAGESSMRGMPFGKAPPDIVSELFAGELAGRPLRVINMAEGGNSAYPQAIRVIRTLKYRSKAAPAALLIYAGHNEQFTAGMRPTPLLLAYEAFKERALIHSLALSELALRAERLFSFRGIKNQARYEFYLRAMIEAARQAGVTPVISTLAGNISGAEPGGADTSPGIAAGLGLELKGKYAEAIARYNSILAALPAKDGERAQPYLVYRLGRCYQALGNRELAREHLLTALETDPEQFRAKPSQNVLIRRLAGEYGLQLVDAERLFAGLARDGLPGAGLFVDLMHPDAPGYLRLSRAFADALAGIFHDKVRRDLKDPAMLFTPPFSADRRAVGRADAYTLAGTSLLWFANGSAPIPDRLKLAEADFKNALAAAPDSNLARTGLKVVKLYQENGNSPNAEIEAWFRSKRPNFEYLRPFSKDELSAADALLRGFEAAGKTAP